MGLNDLATEIAEWRESKGFTTPNRIDAAPCGGATTGDMMLGKLMLVVSELSEASEAVRKNDPENFREEIADAMIRLLDITGTMGINIEDEIEKKMNINRKRPHKHGKKTNL